MSLLSRADIKEMIGREQVFSEGDGRSPVEAHIQPASFDVTVGKIYIPPKSGDECAAEVTERTDFYILEPGAMALVLSREQLKLNSEIGGFVFPKNGDFALKGLLFTNFGHIDPGFSGNLRFTVINMGRQAFTLRHGERIAGVTLFRLTSQTDKYVPQHTSTSETLARVLSRDFLDVETRIAKQAKSTVKEEFFARDLRSWSITLLQILLLFVVTSLTFIFGFQSAVKDVYEKFAATSIEISKLQGQLEALKKTDQPGQQK